jgi:hypothetical protein
MTDGSFESLGRTPDADTSRPQLLIPGLAGFYDAVGPYSYPLLRFITGALLFPCDRQHGEKRDRARGTDGAVRNHD